MDIPAITYRPSIKPTVEELDSVKQFAQQMYNEAIKDLGSLDRIDITKNNVIFRGKDGSREFKRHWLR